MKLRHRSLYFVLSQALKLFLPFIHKKLMSLISDSTMEDENLDKEVLWNLQMMSEIVRSNGQELIKYKHLIVDVLKKSLRMTCKQGSSASRLLLTLVAKKDLQLTKSAYPCPMSINSGSGYEFGATILRNLFKALTLTYCLNYTSVTESLDKDPRELLYVRHWAKPGKIIY